VNITDTSTNTPTMWNWSAGDGNWHNATIGTNFLYQYTKRGVWQASMTTSNAAGTNTSATKQIRVIGYQGFELKGSAFDMILQWIAEFLSWFENFWYCGGSGC